MVKLSRRPKHGRVTPFRFEDLALRTVRLSRPDGMPALDVPVAVREHVIIPGMAEGGIGLLGAPEYYAMSGEIEHVFTLVAEPPADEGEDPQLYDSQQAFGRVVQPFRLTTLPLWIDVDGGLAGESVTLADQPAVLGMLRVSLFQEGIARAAGVPMWRFLEMSCYPDLAALVRRWESWKVSDPPSVDMLWSLESLHVRPEFRGQHLGAALIAHALTALPVTSMDVVALVPSPMPSLFDAIAGRAAPVGPRSGPEYVTAVAGLRRYYRRLGFQTARGLPVPGIMWLDLRYRSPLLLD